MREYNLGEIIYKDQYVTLERTLEDNEDAYACLLDSNNSFITYIGKEFVLETINELKDCEDEISFAKYLIDCGTVDYYFKDEKDPLLKDDILEDYTKEEIKKMTKEQINEIVFNNDYVNKIGEIYIRVA